MQKQGLRGRIWSRIAMSLCLGGSLLPLWPARSLAGQTASQPGLPQPGTPSYSRPSLGNDPSLSPDPLGARAAVRLEHMREEERRKRLLADTAKLVELTTQLKAEVDSTSKDELSVEVVRKAAEIEKLARDVKDRMKS